MLLLYSLVIAAGLAACHIVKGTMPTAVTPATPVVSVAQALPVAVYGQVLSAHDSVTIIPNVEMIFRCQLTDSATQHWRTVLQNNDASYQVMLRPGTDYQLTMRLNGRLLDSVTFKLAEGSAGAGGIMQNFYVSYTDTLEEGLKIYAAYFDTNRAALQPSGRAHLNDFLKEIRAVSMNGTVIVVQGHAEPLEVPTGYPKPEKYLNGLGRERAKAVCAYLEKNGISRNKLLIISYGSRHPAAPNTSPEYQLLNRRAELYIVPLKDISLRYSRRPKPY
ncbi:OmpA family protein [Hymenobacter negativus]|nr:OmpA family protein [Hymenobacter negativus]